MDLLSDTLLFFFLRGRMDSVCTCSARFHSRLLMIMHMPSHLMQSLCFAGFLVDILIILTGSERWREEVEGIWEGV